jgi:hypothetical protein
MTKGDVNGIGRSRPCGYNGSRRDLQSLGKDGDTIKSFDRDWLKAERQRHLDFIASIHRSN